MGVALREIFASYGIEFDRKNLLAGEKAVDNTTKKVKELSKESAQTNNKTNELASALGGLAKVIGASALLRGVASFVQGAVDSTLAQSDMARQLGMSTVRMREWQHVAELTGLPVETMNSAMQTLVGNMRSVQMGNSDMSYAFRRLHVPVRDAGRNLRDTSDVMVEAGSAIARIENPTRRARLATQIFGDAGRQLIPIFEQGGTAIESMREEVRGLLDGNMQQMEQQSRRVRAEQARWNLAIQALTNTVVLQLLPAFTWIMQGATAVARYLKETSATTYLVRAAMTAAIPVMIALFWQLGAAMLAAFGPALLAMAPFIAGVLAAIFVLDELYALFNGGDSVIGQFIDALFGVGAAKTVVREVKQSYEDFVSWLSGAIETVVNTMARIPGVGALLRNLGVGPTTAMDGLARQNTRGFIPSQSLALSNAATRSGVISPASATLGGRRTQQIDARTNVGTIVVQGVTDAEATANAVAGRLRNENDAAARSARAALIRAVQSRDEEA